MRWANKGWLLHCRSCDGAEMSSVLSGINDAFNLPDSLLSPLAPRQPPNMLVGETFITPHLRPQPPHPQRQIGAALGTVTRAPLSSMSGKLRHHGGGMWAPDTRPSAETVAWPALPPPQPPAEQKLAPAPAGLWSSLSQASIWGLQATPADDEGWAALAAGGTPTGHAAGPQRESNTSIWRSPMPWSG